jgi:hypothetical protein
MPLTPMQRGGAEALARDRDAVERVDRDEQPAERDVLLFAEDAADAVVDLVGIPSSWMKT